MSLRLINRKIYKIYLIIFNIRFSRYMLVFCSFTKYSGDGEIRTLDPLLARQVLSQLSYAPIWVTYLIIQSHSASGLEKTRTSDLTLIRRAL